MSPSDARAGRDKRRPLWGSRKGEMVDSTVLAGVAAALSLVSLIVSGTHCAVRRSSNGVDISARFDGSSEELPLGVAPPQQPLGPYQPSPPAAEAA